MNQGKQELLLRLFLKSVESGKQPSKEQLELVADGVRRFLKHEKPWQSKQGRRKRGADYETQNKMICAYLLNEISVERARISLLMDNTSESTLKRYIRDGKAIANVWNTGFFMCMFGIEHLLDNYPLKSTEKTKLKTYKDKLQAESDELDKEPDYL